MTHADLRDRLRAYAGGTLDDADAEAVRRHLATGCPVCLREVFTRPVGLPRQPIIVQGASRGMFVAAAVVAAGVGTGIGLLLGMTWDGRVRGDDPVVAALAGEVERLRVERERADATARERLARLEARFQEAERTRTLAGMPPAPPAGDTTAGDSPDAEDVPAWVAELQASDGARVVALASADAAPGASGYAVWSPARGLVVVSAAALPRAAGDAVYRARVTLDDGSTAWVGDVAASERGALLLTVSLPEGAGRRVTGVDLYRDPPGTPALTARVR